MTKEQTPQRTKAVARWFGMQVAAKAVSLALGAPIITGAIMAALAYLQGLPLAWAFLGVILAAASVSTLLNQARTFLLAYSAINKIVVEGAEVLLASNPQGVGGYGIGVPLKNTADIPLEFQVTRASAHLDGRVAKSFMSSGKGCVIDAGGRTIYRIGLIPMDKIKSKVVSGEIEIEFIYGRPGKLSYSIEQKFMLSVSMNAKGDVESTSTYLTS